MKTLTLRADEVRIGDQVQLEDGTWLQIRQLTWEDDEHLTAGLHGYARSIICGAEYKFKVRRKQP